jgi:RND family efflux transporter MFP subunit
MILEPQTIGKTIEYSSTLEAFEEVHLVSASPGKIDEILVEVGSRVKKGDVLVKMDQTQLLQSMLQLQNLEADYKRLDTLQKVGGISQQQFDQIKTQYEVTKANVNFLQKNTQLKAPFDGVISGKYFENGEMYSGVPNTTSGKAAIISIVQIDLLKATVNIPETYFPQVSTGMKATITCDIYPGQTYTGTILRKYPIVDPATHSFEVEIQVSNPGEKLRPGMFVRVSIGLGETKALIVPAIALVKQEGTNDRYLFVVKNGNIARKIRVEIGERYNDKIEILSPEIHEGDQIIVSGQEKLLDNSSVTIVQ